MSTPPKTFSLAVAGGGTGGHTYPALTTIEALRARLATSNTTLEVTWYGTTTGLEARIAAEHQIAFRALAAGKIRRSMRPGALARTAVDLFRVPIGVLQATWALARTRPDVVLSTGGYVAVPIGLAARLTGRPLVMHEQITTLGLANRLLARVASAVALSHDSSLEYLPRRVRATASVTGNPIRAQLLTGDPTMARTAYHLDPDLPLLYVTGGAQGAQQINHLITAILPDLLAHCQILHQCGPHAFEQLKADTAALPPELSRRYILVPYVSGELANVLAAADLVVARAGAGTLAELTAVGKACVLIPLMPTAGDEQRRNAELLAGAGAAVALIGDGANAQTLRAELIPLLQDRPTRQAMAKAAKALGHPDAAQALVDVLLRQAQR